MIAAMAVTVSAASTLRLASFAQGFSSGKPAFADGAGALVTRGAEAGSGSCAAGPLSDGLSKLDGEAVAMTGAWSTSALGQPSAYLPNVPRPKKTNTALPFIVEVNPRAKGCASSVGCMVHHRQLATAA
jgi:hypothetical protein